MTSTFGQRQDSPSMALAVLALEMAARLYGVIRRRLLLLQLGDPLGIGRLAAAGLAVETLDEAGIVEAADVVQVPQLHRIDLAGIRILALGLLVDIGDRRHGGIEPGRQ